MFFSQLLGSHGTFNFSLLKPIYTLLWTYVNSLFYEAHIQSMGNTHASFTQAHLGTQAEPRASVFSLACLSTAYQMASCMLDFRWESDTSPCCLTFLYSSLPIVWSGSWHTNNSPKKSTNPQVPSLLWVRSVRVPKLVLNHLLWNFCMGGWLTTYFEIFYLSTWDLNPLKNF